MAEQTFTPVVVSPEGSRRKLVVSLAAMAMAALTLVTVSRSSRGFSLVAAVAAATQSLQDVAETYQVRAQATDVCDELQGWADGPGGMQHFMTVEKKDGVFALRFHPGLDEDGWGSTLYAQPFFPPGSLGHTEHVEMKVRSGSGLGLRILFMEMCTTLCSPRQSVGGGKFI